jgi:hypothetical protein
VRPPLLVSVRQNLIPQRGTTPDDREVGGLVSAVRDAGVRLLGLNSSPAISPAPTPGWCRCPTASPTSARTSTSSPASGRRWRCRRSTRCTGSGRPGPVLIDLPFDVQMAEIDFGAETYAPLPVYKPVATRAQVDRALDLLLASARPVIIAGAGPPTTRSWSTPPRCSTANRSRPTRAAPSPDACDRTFLRGRSVDPETPPRPAPPPRRGLTPALVPAHPARP